MGRQWLWPNSRSVHLSPTAHATHERRPLGSVSLLENEDVLNRMAERLKATLRRSAIIMVPYNIVQPRRLLDVRPRQRARRVQPDRACLQFAPSAPRRRGDDVRGSSLRHDYAAPFARMSLARKPLGLRHPANEAETAQFSQPLAPRATSSPNSGSFRTIGNVSCVGSSHSPRRQGMTAIWRGTAAHDVKLPFAMTGPKTTAGKVVFQMAKVVAGILRLIAELRPPPVTSSA